MLSDVEGVRVGHWTDSIGGTGCTVVLLPDGTVASGEVRGGAPGTRDFELLAPTRMVQHINAVSLSGGSAFGLATCEGVMRWCDENDLGLETRFGKIPIVVGAIIFDLSVGDAKARPSADNGYAAAASATNGAFETGAVGAGTGATIGKIGTPDRKAPSGIGTATERDGDIVVSALMVVNAAGYLRGPADAPTRWETPDLQPLENTTIGVIATNAMLDKNGCFLTAQSGHSGLARAIDPSHTSADGDAIVACATGKVEAEVERVRFMAAHAVEAAIRNAVP